MSILRFDLNIKMPDIERFIRYRAKSCFFDVSKGQAPDAIQPFRVKLGQLRRLGFKLFDSSGFVMQAG